MGSFCVIVVAFNLFFILNFAFSTEISKLPSTLSPLRKRGSLQILPVVVICKLRVFELRKCCL